MGREQGCDFPYLQKEPISPLPLLTERNYIQSHSKLQSHWRGIKGASQYKGLLAYLKLNRVIMHSD